MKINYKKSLKLVTLLITALLIATASATIYNYMYMYATPIGVTNIYDVNFYAGNDTSTAGGTITNNLQTVTFANMKGSNGSLATYTDAVRICNNASGIRNVEVTKESWTGDTLTTLNYVNITLYDSSNNYLGRMSLIPNGGNSTTGAYNLAGNHDWWRVQWDILWFANATTSDSVNINLKIIVHD